MDLSPERTGPLGPLEAARRGAKVSRKRDIDERYAVLAADPVAEDASKVK